MKSNKVTFILVIACLSFMSLVSATPLLRTQFILPRIILGTITDASSRAEFTGDGSTVDFAFTFPILATSDIVLIHRVIATGVETVLTETTDYSLSATNNDYSSGGTITTVATYASTVSLTALRDIPDSQNTVLEDSGVLRLAGVEDGLDKLTMLVEQLQEEVDRCLKYPRSDASSLSSELPNSVDRASTTFIWSSGSTPTTQ